MENLYNELLQEAKKASNNSYSPYSKFSVGACVLFESNAKHCGANVENATEIKYTMGPRASLCSKFM